MSVVDFAHSYMTWFPNDQGNIARILRRPTPLADGAGPSASTTDYSLVQVLSARNEIYCGPA